MKCIIIDEQQQTHAVDHQHDFTLTDADSIRTCKQLCAEYVAYLKNFLAGNKPDNDLRNTLLRDTPPSSYKHVVKEMHKRDPYDGNCIPIVSLLATEYCNLSCKGCGAVMPMRTDKKIFNIDDLQRVLTRLAKLNINVTKFDVVGGEPLLHPNIVDFVTILRDVFPTSQISIITNGLLVPQQTDAFFQTLVDKHITLSLSVYGDNCFFETTGIVNTPVDDHKDCSACTGHVPCLLTAKRDIRYSNHPLLDTGDLFYCGFNSAQTLNAAFGCSFDLVENVDYVNVFKVTTDQVFEMLRQPQCAFSIHCVPRHTFPWGISSKVAHEWVEDM